MTLRIALLAALLSVAIPALAEDQWSATIKEGDVAERSHSPDEASRHLRKPLKLAERFGESDVRLLDTLIRLADTCTYADDCGTGEAKGFLDRALGLRSK